MKEFTPGICWQESYTQHQKSVNALNNAGFRMLRIFFNLCDLPYIAVPNQTYIKNLFATMPNPLHAWQFEGRASPNTTTEPMRYAFDFCKKYNWLPIVCMGYQEEQPHNWLGRNPSQDKWVWLGKFCKEFAIFLHDIYGFNRADMEVWNEPSKVFYWDKYCALALIMTNGWKYIPNYKVHIFADDILRQSYLDLILSYPTLCNKVDYISTHIGVGSEDSEWDDQLIFETNHKISKYPHLKQALTEMSVNGVWSRLNQLPDEVAMYGIIGAIRNIEFGTATRIDDIWMWDRAGNLQTTSPTKAQILRDFNNKYYIPYTVVEDDMILQKIYKIGSKGIAVKFIQKVLNEDINVELVTKLIVDGNFGAITASAVKEYQKEYNLVQDGMVGEKTMKVMIFDNPNLWDELQYDYAVGYR